MVKEKNNLFKLKSLYNVRDMGGFVTSEGLRTKKYKYIRGSAKGSLTESEKKHFHNIGVRVIIDLRYKEETEKNISPLRDYEDMVYYHVDMMGEFYQMRSAGYVDLSELYVDLLNDSQAEIKQVFDIFLDHLDDNIYFHCTAGKDRTGIIAMLLFELVGLDRAEIVRNYAESYENNKERPGYKKLPPEWVKLVLSEPEYMEKTLAFIDEKYGGSHAYLRLIGLSEDELIRLKDNFLQ